MKKSILLASVALVLTQCAVSQAALVTTVLTLDATVGDGPAPSDNRLNLSFLTGTATTDLSGTMIADIEINQVTGEIDFFNFVGGSMIGTAWSMTGLASSTASTATADTIPAFSDVTGTSFNAAENRIRLLSGTVSPGAIPLAGTDIEGSGTGMITSTLNGGVFDIFFTMNIDDSETIPPSTLGIVGTVVARGTITAVPEPTCAIALTGLIAGVLLRRRRR